MNSDHYLQLIVTPLFRELTEEQKYYLMQHSERQSSFAKNMLFAGTGR
jgi:hypothetical protein